MQRFFVASDLSVNIDDLRLPGEPIAWDEALAGSEIVDAPVRDQLRQSIVEGIAMADRLGLTLVGIWLEHARHELSPWPDAEHCRDDP